MNGQVGGHVMKFIRLNVNTWLRNVRLAVFFLICLPTLSLAACASTVPSPTALQEVSPAATNTQVVLPPTWTIGPTATSGSTPTPLPSRTPLATETPIPTLGPSPTSFPPIIPASDNNFPSLSYGLLFLEGGKLNWLNRDTGRVEELVEKEVGPTEVTQGTLTPAPEIDITETPVPTEEPSSTATEGIMATATRTPFPTVTPIVGGGTASPTPQSGLVLTATPVEGDVLKDISQFAMQTQGGRVVMERTVGASGHEIVLYDRFTREVVWTLSLEAEEIAELSISPDGRWVALIVAVLGDEEGEAEDLQYVLNTISVDSAEVVEIGICEGKCVNLLWSLASGSLIWGDEAGLRSSRPPFNSNIEVLLEPFLVQATASQSITDSYAPLIWSPSGRYLLLQVGLEQSDKRAVFAPGEGMVKTIPGPFVLADPYLGITWLADDRIFVSRPGDFADSRLPSAEIWQIDPSSEEGLLLIDSLQVGSAPGEAVYIPQQLPDGRIAYALLDIRSALFKPSFGLYALDLGAGEATKLNDLPAIKIREGRWVPDGSGVLITTLRNTLFVPTNGDAIFDLRGILGLSACCYRWVK